MSSGNSSRRPANISNIRTYFEKLLKKPKFPVGPTSERPGPMLLIVAATEVNDVVAPYPSNDIANMERANKNMNVMKYALVALTTSCSIGLPSNFIFLTLLG